ncbi:MAG: hypothetical protein A2504_04960 [Bdellovibrionales bacterium RIFOXYD12_FULL_39_22]|nr:MAG: hypothetical protein A2385_06865 [Bdellovibrionales bacterium RIFOXYB1_FULL_39_21]OFZ41988.1 MAG: hypothetical protein A2485_08835 [Bdellovibrionales bacterium RIFOXYC12_FULL_39_17]OFZ50704.1 MAG: hypothetical protein A2404_05785 [Bdellovibrionales bacterium RIFOXYC1_FULL_39_130]OFZ77927.1 MAG: hypothetical protein A2560_00955 [Bdellovibrionales bacterium RIFOXYD1_FULL_39_84]OFZ93637.1 MAG: hypothetical protein A2504_04960 [Bdellovibrionales bacterium RIFOXYD12_FULL_39_22]HLE10234.1 ir
MNIANKRPIIFLLLLFLYLAGAGSLLLIGPLDLSAANSDLIKQIIWDLRLPKMIAAAMAGSSLALCGLLLQTFFKNPLADPYILGVSSGSALGVVTWIMLAHSAIVGQLLGETWINVGSGIFSFIGSFLISTFVVFLSRQIVSSSMILIVGIIVSYLASTIINIFVSVSDIYEIKSFLLWSLGSFSRISLRGAQLFLGLSILAFISSMALAVKLNLFLMGENYAQTLGVNIKKLKLFVLIISSILVGATTSFCGPIAFVGIIAPHIARSLFSTNDHKVIMPAVFLVGGAVTLWSQVALEVWAINIPFNAIVSLMGIPIILYLLIRNGRSGGHNDY